MYLGKDTVTHQYFSPEKLKNNNYTFSPTIHIIISLWLHIVFRNENLTKQ